MDFAASFAPLDLVYAFVALFVLSSVVFVHELGHYLAARWAGVMVERFSIGMGPVAWSFKWGETEYALSWIPLGGYVKMMGQTDTPEVEVPDNHPRSYQSKTVLQRMVIISAGVAMNVVFGFILFACAYLAGVPYPPAVIGSVQPGRPAWIAGIRTGDRLLTINGNPKNDFNDIRRTVMLANPRTETVKFEVARKDGSAERTLTFDVRPFRAANGLHPQVGVGPAPGLTLFRFEDDDFGLGESPVAKAANPGFKGGERILEIDGREIVDYRDLQNVLYEKRAAPIVVKVRRDADDKKKEAPVEEIKVEPNYVRTFGLIMQMGKIEALRQDSPATAAKNAETGEPFPLQTGDLITKIDGSDDFDPMRLPDTMSERAGKEVVLEILREGRLPQTYKVKVTPESSPAWSDFPDGIFYITGDEEKFSCSIPSLGVAYAVGRTVRKVVADSPAAKTLPPIEPGDVVEKIEFRTQVGKNSKVESLKVENNWPQVFFNMQHARVDRKATLTLQRKDAAGAALKIALESVPDRTWPYPDRGFELMADKQILRDSTFFGAMGLGLDRTKSAITDIYLTFRQLGQGNVSTKTFSGPLSIFALLFQLAKSEIGLLLWFTAFLSINLAIINFLPIPILDGGHMAFLTYELIFRRPPTGWIVGVLNYAGVAFLLCLMVYVISLDLLRITGYMRM